MKLILILPKLLKLLIAKSGAIYYRLNTANKFTETQKSNELQDVIDATQCVGIKNTMTVTGILSTSFWQKACDQHPKFWNACIANDPNKRSRLL